MGLADSIPYLVPTQFQELTFPHKPIQKYWLSAVKNVCLLTTLIGNYK
jgi:hypothetical protein